jgi:hypothetical protein
LEYALAIRCCRRIARNPLPGYTISENALVFSMGIMKMAQRSEESVGENNLLTYGLTCAIAPIEQFTVLIWQSISTLVLLELDS